jgi:hypothetical protein
MRVHFKITDLLLRHIQCDLRRPHSVALERVGFVTCRVGRTADGLMVLARGFKPVADEHYMHNPHVGAAINGDAVRLALQHAYAYPDVMMFIHEHAHDGPTRPSRVDLECWRRMIPNFWNVRPELPHGALILSHDSGMGQLWIPHQTGPVGIGRFSVVGTSVRRWSC